jgi:hypothetical protein
MTRFHCGVGAGVGAGSAIAAGVAVVLLLCGFGQQTAPVLHSPVIATATASFDEQAAVRGEERFPRGAHLVVVRNGHAEPLVEGYAATADADVSFDGNKVLFAGKRDAAESWAIWELTLADHSTRKVVGGGEDLVRPMYLPDERMVYARRTSHGFQLETAGLDGTGASALSFVSGSALPLDVLADGRILFESGYPLGTNGSPEMYLVYSDGSGVESYRCDHGKARWGGKQVASGDVVFTEGATLERFTSALAEEERVAAPAAEYSGGFADAGDGALLVSARAKGAAHSSLQLLRPGAQALRMVYAEREEDLAEPVLVRERVRPHRHPSGLHEWGYSNLLALDARESRGGDLKIAPAAVRVEALDRAGKTVELGQAPVESDGSFFVKTPADRPIRFALLDTNGKVLRQEHGWFWARRGEQRICVGCHTGPERAPENRVPAVLLRSTTAADVTGTAKEGIAGSR